MTSPAGWRAPFKPTARPRSKEWLAGGVCFVGIVGVTLGGACDSGGTECQCEPTGLLLQICPALAGSVQSIQLSGSACVDAALYPIDAGADALGGKDYVIQPSTAGMCGVVVSFDNGLSFAADQGTDGLVLAPGPGCCPGLYPNGPRDIAACVDASSVDVEAPSDAPSGS